MNKTGRPRSEKAREAILGATHALLHENDGKGLTIEAIARRAGVGKPTIYRWWPSLADIVLDALRSQADATIAIPQYASLHQCLQEFLRQSMQAINQGAGVHLRFLMAQAQTDQAFRKRFQELFVAKRRAVLRALLQKGVERGDIPPEQNLEILVDIIFGAMWYRLLTGHAPVDVAFADELTATVLRLFPKPSTA